MIELCLSPADLDNIHFGVSSLTELWQSVRALQSPAARIVRPRWLVDTLSRVEDLDLSLLFALQPAGGYLPDFVSPPPRGPLIHLDDELAHVADVPHARVRFEVRRAYDGSDVPPNLRMFIDSPGAAVRELVDLLRNYWDRAVGPHWDRIRVVLEGEVLYRARQSASGGARSVLADIDPMVCYSDSRLVIDKPGEDSVELDGRGLVLVPSVFGSPGVLVGWEEPWQPIVIYPARGSELLWEPAQPVPGALGALVGRRRAAVLTSLEAPTSTTALAARLSLSPSSVSDHLSVLHQAGLVNRHRLGQVVFYRRSSVGELLVSASSADSRPDRAPAAR